MKLSRQGKVFSYTRVSKTFRIKLKISVKLKVIVKLSTVYLRAACAIFDIKLITEKFNLVLFFFISTATNVHLYNFE